MEDNKYTANLKTLHVLLVISFIVSGLYFLSELVSGLTLPWMPDQWNILLERSLSIPQWYYLLCALLDAISVIGLVLMWRLRRNGFHCYALSKLLLMLMPLLFLDRSYVGAGNIMLGVLFIVYYYYLMRILTSSTDVTPPASEGE